MNVNVIQPRYSMDYRDAEQCTHELLELMDTCTEDMDIIVLPEYSDVLTAVPNKAVFDNLIATYHQQVMDKAVETAIRCRALVFINATFETNAGYRNTTYAIDPKGQIIGKYFKSHPAPSEVRGGEQGGVGLDVGYSYKFQEPYVLEWNGLRFAFLTCYDFYFYEAYPSLARQNLDIIIGTSLQRTDTHQALEIIGKFLCYQTNAYLLRASVSLGEASPTCGSSMVVAPDGTVLLNMKNDVGIGTVDIDPQKKYYKAAGFGGAMKAHYEYIEEGRRPWNYRPAGTAIVPDNEHMPYPRVCAHRGFNTIAPENTLPAFGAAIALGAEEIEFDIWPTSDGEIVSCHDDTLDRVSTGTGKIYEHTLAELKQLDFGVKYGDRFKDLPIVTLEEILQKFACHTIMNIHVKPVDRNRPYPEDMMKKIISLLRKYDCMKHSYVLLETDTHIRQFKAYAPELTVCVGWREAEPWSIVDHAIATGAEMVQLFKPYYNREMVEKAHVHGIICNVFWSDDVQETWELLDMGVETILSNDYHTIANAVDAWRREHGK